MASFQVSAVISLGTGMIPVTELKEIDVFRPDSLFDAAKLAYGISAIGEYMKMKMIVHEIIVDSTKCFFLQEIYLLTKQQHLMVELLIELEPGAV